MVRMTRRGGRGASDGFVRSFAFASNPVRHVTMPRAALGSSNLHVPPQPPFTTTVLKTKLMYAMLSIHRSGLFVLAEDAAVALGGGGRGPLLTEWGWSGHAARLASTGSHARDVRRSIRRLASHSHTCAERRCPSYAGTAAPAAPRSPPSGRRASPFCLNTQAHHPTRITATADGPVSSDGAFAPSAGGVWGPHGVSGA